MFSESYVNERNVNKFRISMFEECFKDVFPLIPIKRSFANNCWQADKEVRPIKRSARKVQNDKMARWLQNDASIIYIAIVSPSKFPNLK